MISIVSCDMRVFKEFKTIVKSYSSKNSPVEVQVKTRN